jgi:hypothetical protein
MAKWPQKPFLYQINTWVWLSTLSQQYNTPITLTNVPDATLDELVGLGVDAVWLMGIWWRSAAARSSALNYKHEYVGALPDLRDQDVVGSAYAIRAYEVDPNIGGREGLAALRARLAARGILLMLDFIPNHTATDHHWIDTHPSHYLQGTPRDLKKRGDVFFQARDAWQRPLILAHGRDPYFPPWIDTAQLNAFAPSYRQQSIETLRDVASQCDGVRCDMAMLMLNAIFEQTWGLAAGEVPEREYWTEVIHAVKDTHPDFIFIAEVYWGLEQRLQELGFDYTYDKAYYDYLVEGNTGKATQHLRAMVQYQRRTVRFIENHDEPRAASHIGVKKSQAAAVLVCTTLGMTLLHDGQLTGRRIKLPVQITRQPNETVNEELRDFYRILLKETRHPIYNRGTWQLFDVTAASEGDDGYHHIVSYGWYDGTDYRLIVVNLTDQWSRAIVKVAQWDHLQRGAWSLVDVFKQARPIHFGGDHLVKHGVYVEMNAHSAHIYRMTRTP